MQRSNTGLSKPNYLASVPRQPLTQSPDEDIPFDGFFGDDMAYDAQVVDAVPFDAIPVQRVTYGKHAPPLVCPTCKTPIGETAHGWLVTRTSRNGPIGGKKETVPCPACSGDVQQRNHARRQAELVQRLFGGADIPWAMQDWDFSSYPHFGDQSAKAQMHKFVQSHLNGERIRRGMWLGGDLGHGKTSLAISALKDVIRHGHLGLFVLTSDLFQRIRASFRKDATEHGDELLEAIQTVSWLVLDDLGVERPTSYVIEQLYGIVSLRMQRGLYTIFTSNFNPRDLQEHWCKDGENVIAGQRIIARLREYCAGIQVNGQNLREKAR